jgi:mono/diheme cytochrome c family protein
VEPREPNTLAGVYTDAQAQRGRQVFENICSTCHNTEEWQDELFLARWEGESVYRFWFFIYERMPDDAPPYSLPREQVSDVLTYILQLNGLPSGDTELGSDDDSIDPYWLHWGSLGF